jgi:GH25 family lysozyme M1 (1,4-beta-N-acetylmuramidase)
MSNIKGIDISKWQGIISAETFRKFKEQGIEFVIIRAYCNGKDTCFESNYKNVKSAGLSVGAYCYIYGKTVPAVKYEAEKFLDSVKGKTFEYPLYLDIEDESLENLDKNLLTDMCIAFCDTIENAGYYCGIYANPAWFDGRLDKSRLTKYDKWLAHWVSVPKYGDEFGGLWQYGTGKLNGYNGEIDMDISYRDYPQIIKNAGLNGFEKLVQTETQIETKYDVNGDGKVTSEDALTILNKVIGK